MGASSSKKEEEDEDKVFDTSYISYDDKGNLRYGLVHPIKRTTQLKEILELDFVDEEKGRTWYIMDSAWIASWLAYVNIARGVAPCPGSCNNKRLLVYDYEEQKYVKRPGLMMAVKEQAGDFRRVSEEVWLKFKEYYPESGPAVTMIFTEDDNSLEKCEWVVLDKLDPPNDTEKKKKKLNFAKFLSKKDKNKDAVGENEENVTHISNDHTTTNIAALLLESNREVVTTKDNNVAPDSTPKNNVKNESYFEDVYFGKEK